MDSALRRVPVGTTYTPESSVSVVASLDICEHVSPQPDASLPFRPAGWQLQSENRQPRDGDNQQGNSP